MDGHHEASYLAGEIQTVLPLMRLGGFVILDDVDAAWAEIREVFSQIASFGLEPIGTDDRVGIAQLVAKPSHTGATPEIRVSVSVTEWGE
jgi:hypothetical protein